MCVYSQDKRNANQLYNYTYYKHIYIIIVFMYAPPKPFLVVQPCAADSIILQSLSIFALILPQYHSYHFPPHTSKCIVQVQHIDRQYPSHAVVAVFHPHTTHLIRVTKPQQTIIRSCSFFFKNCNSL